MDIGSGTGYPSAALSNFAPHSFVIDGVGSFLTRKCKNTFARWSERKLSSRVKRNVGGETKNCIGKVTSLTDMVTNIKNCWIELLTHYLKTADLDELCSQLITLC